MSNNFDDLEARERVLRDFAALVGHICSGCRYRKPGASIENCGGGATISKGQCPGYGFRMWGRDLPAPILRWLTYCDEAAPAARKDY